MIKGVIVIAVSFGLSWIPNLNTPPKRQVIITDQEFIDKFERCGNIEELKVNTDLQHHCQGVEYVYQ